MEKEFHKIIVPGPDSEEEKRHEEMENMMHEWYDESRREEFQEKRRSNVRPVFAVFILFLIIAGLSFASIYMAIEGKWWFAQERDGVEKDPALLLVETPMSVDSGDEVAFIVTISNITKARLIDVMISMLYPDNFIFTKSSPYDPKNFDKNTWDIPVVEPLSSIKLEVTGTILGKSQEEKSVKTVLTYKPTNFHSTFKQESTQTFAIAQSVVDITLTAPENLLPGQPVSFTVIVSNTSEKPQENLVVRLTYPEGLLDIQTSNPVREGRWIIPQLEMGKDAELVVSGNLLGAASELKEFKAEVGVMQAKGSENEFVLQNQVVHIASVIDPRIMIEVEKNTGSDFYFGEEAAIDVRILNVSTLTFNSLTAELVIDDTDDIVAWDTLSVRDESTFEVIASSADLHENERKIRLTNLPALAPTEEIVRTITVSLIEVPYDISVEEYSLIVTPRIVAESKDLTVNVEKEGELKVFTIDIPEPSIDESVSL